MTWTPAPRTTLGWSCPLLLLAIASPGVGWAADTAEERAVEALNVTLTPIRYTHEGERSADAWSGAAALTFPIGRRFGGRIEAEGGGESLPTFDTTRKVYRVGGDLFWRDRNRGYVELGYRFGQRFVDEFDFQEDGHTVRVGGGGFFDRTSLDLLFEYTDLAPLRIYEIDFGPRQYLIADQLSLGAGLLWKRWDTLNGAVDVLLGGIEASWQPPSGEVRYTTVNAGVAFGRRRVDFRNDPTSEEQFAWRIDLGLTVYLPGTRSLLERDRAYR